MSNALAPANNLVPEKFANPLRQIQGALAQPAVRRAGPMALMVGLIGAAGLAWSALSTPPQKTLFAGLPDADKAAVTSALTAANIPSHIDDGAGTLTVNEEDYSKARLLLAGQGLPKAAPGGYAILDQLPMGVSRAVEGERLRQARETEIARSIQEIDAVAASGDVESSVLRNAPHTAAELAGEWPHSYDRSTAVFPVGVDAADKYWPPVGRVDNVHGDRNLICTCPPVESYAEAAE